jgi:hypothetical protein
MDPIRSPDPRTTDALLRQVAEDAGQTPEPHYRALGADFHDKQARLEPDKHRPLLGRHEGPARMAHSGIAKTLAMGAVKVFGFKGTEKLEAATDAAAAMATRFAPTLRLASAANAVAGVLGMAYELMDEGFVRPHAEGDALRSAAANDAMVVGLTESLDAPDGFKSAMARMRPETATGGGAVVMAQLMGKDRSLLPVLQMRADDGLTQARGWAEKIAASDSHTRLRLMEQFEKSDVGQRAKDDAAFGVGVAEALWAAGARANGRLQPDAYEALFTSANARLDVSKPPVTIRD